MNTVWLVIWYTFGMETTIVTAPLEHDQCGLTAMNTDGEDGLQAMCVYEPELAALLKAQGCEIAAVSTMIEYACIWTPKS